MTVLVASDLDRTVIYSAAARTLGHDGGPAVCVEVYDGRPTSFMTSEAVRRWERLATIATIVPVTTRTVEQLRRVRLPVAPRLAIAANGGVLLVDDEPDASWTATVAAAVAESAPVREVWAHVEDTCDAEFVRTRQVAQDLFCYAVLRLDAVPAGFVAEQAEWAASRGWRTSVQGRKIYWVPDGLTKAAALGEVARRVGVERILAAGDSLLDVDLLEAADLAIRPRHGELFDSGWSAAHVSTTVASGIAAGAEILGWFAAHVDTSAVVCQTGITSVLPVNIFPA